MSVSQVKLGAIFVGWIISVFLLFVIIMGVAAAVVALGANVLSLTHKISGLTYFSLNLVVFLAIFVSFFIGGYVAGRMAAYAGALNGAMVVVTNVLVEILAIVFVIVFDNKLGIGIADPFIKTLSSLAVGIVVATAFALTGGVLGGKYGEGYINRLDLALGITKPTSTIPHAQQEASWETKQASANKEAGKGKKAS